MSQIQKAKQEVISEAQEQIKQLDSAIRSALAESIKLFDCGLVQRSLEVVEQAHKALIQIIALEEAVKALGNI